MTIIKANIDHLDDIVPLFDAYRQFYRQPQDLVGAREFILNRLKNKDSIIYLAYLDNKAVAFTQLYFLFSSVSMEPMLLLNDLYVDKDYRDRNLGSLLIERAKEYCRSNRQKGMAIQTETSNRAQELYKRLGFKVDPDLHMFWKTH